MRRIRITTDANNQITATDYLTINYMRVQPITADIATPDKQSSLQYTGQKIFFEPSIDVRPTDKIEFEGLVYEIKSFYKPRDRFDVAHHIEVII